MRKKIGNSINNSYELEFDKVGHGPKNYLFGIYKGVVVDNRDPTSLGRCKIRVYQMHGDEMATPDETLPFSAYMSPEAGTDSGSFTPPDVGSRVWVMYEQGDINSPVYTGGWFTQNSGSPDEPESKQADKVKSKGDKAKDDAAKGKEAADLTQTTANSLGGAVDKGIQAAEKTEEAADSVSDAIDEIINTTPTSATSGDDIPDATKQKFNNSALKVNAAKKEIDAAKDKVAVSQEEVDTCLSTASSTEASIEESNLEIGRSLSSIVNSSQVTSTTLVEANNVKSATKIVESSSTTLGASKNNKETGELMVAPVTSLGVTVTDLDTQHTVISGAVASISSLLGSSWDYSSFLNTLTGHKTNTAAAGSKVKDTIQPSLTDRKKETDDLIAKAIDVVKKATLAKNDSKKAAAGVKKKIAKTANKKYDDPVSWAKRPYDCNDESNQVEPGHESPVEAQAMASNVPSMKVLKKTGKGHAIYFNDMDSKESLAIVDRAGNALYMDCPVPSVNNAGNALQRGSKTALTGDALEQRDMRDGGSKIGLKDQAQSKIELDSREGAEKIIIIANDGQQSGVENGKNRQVITVSSGGNSITIESIKGGDVKSKIVVDANSGAVQIEAATCVQLNAKFISIKADHINLDGRVNINGDATVAGRFTGGNT
jgi:hypothetical protein